MKCTDYNKRGKPCGNDAEPGTDRCAFHPRPQEAAETAPQPPRIERPPELAPAAPSPPSPPAGGELPPGIGVSGPHAAEYHAVAAAVGAAAIVTAAEPPDDDPDVILAALGIGQAPAPDAEPAAAPKYEPAPSGAAAAAPLPSLDGLTTPANRFAWTPKHAAGLLNGPVNALHRRWEIDELDPGEVAWGAEVLVPVLNDLFGRINPNTAAGALAYWAFVTYSHRVGGRILAYLPGVSMFGGGAPGALDVEDAPQEEQGHRRRGGLAQLRALEEAA